MMSVRSVEPELLDNLAAQDPAAQRSRRDLQRLHRAMGTRATLLRALRALPVGQPGTPRLAPLRLLELGAGDGSLMLGVARALHGVWPAVALTLLDRQHVLAPATVAHFAAVGWTVDAKVGDVLDWATEDAMTPRWDLIVANLFLHHFQSAQLASLLAAVAERSTHFLACEPRRAWMAWAGSHLVGALGASAVTRVDAVLSVHAGFRGTELSTLWPSEAPGWTLTEYPAHLFSHCLLASRAPDAQAHHHRNPQPHANAL